MGLAAPSPVPSTNAEYKISLAGASVIWVGARTLPAVDRFKVALDAVYSNGKSIDKVEAFGVLGQDRRERAGHNVLKFVAIAYSGTTSGRQKLGNDHVRKPLLRH